MNTPDQKAEATVQYWLAVFDESYRLRKAGLRPNEIETDHAIDIAARADNEQQMQNAQQSSAFIIKLACAFADDNSLPFDRARVAVEAEIRAQIADHLKGQT